MRPKEAGKRENGLNRCLALIPEFPASSAVSAHSAVMQSLQMPDAPEISITTPAAESPARNAAVVMVTFDRRDEVLCALDSIRTQSVSPRVVVLVNGSTDHTAEAVRERHPHVEVIDHPEARPLLARRQELLERVECEAMIILDDDAVLTHPETLARSLADLDHPRVGAVAIPVHERGGVRVPRGAADRPEAVARFLGAAAVLRRRACLDAGGWFVDLGMYYEEDDLCLKLLANGWFCRLGTAEPVEHNPSPSHRDSGDRIRRATASKLRFRWRHLRWSWLIHGLPTRLAWDAVYSLRHGCFRPVARGYADAFKLILTRRTPRDPVPPDVQRLWLRLRRHGPLPFDAMLHDGSAPVRP